MRYLLTIFLFFSILNISAQGYTSSRQISPDIKVTTDHTSIILGKKVNYEAQVGTQPIWN